MFDEFPEPACSQLAAAFAFAEGRTKPEWCFPEGRARLAFWAPRIRAGLTYRPARDLRPDEVLALLMGISEGSLDHDTQVEPASAGAAQEARWMDDDLVDRKAKPDWFVVGRLGGSPVGLVAPDDHRIAYIARGARAPRPRLRRRPARARHARAGRGRRAAHRRQDPANAFLRAGYSEVGRLFRYYWRAS
ncbi:hypothetical protein ACWEJ6_03005 [Nonomuraea sp. NPDC004702]